MREEHTLLHVERCARQRPPRRADEIAESVDRAYRRRVERTDERCTRQVCRMMLDVSHPRTNDVLVETGRRGNGVREATDRRHVACAISECPLWTVPQHEQRLAPEMRPRLTGYGEQIDVLCSHAAHSQACV